MTQLIQLTEQLISWFKQDALPLWTTTGVDQNTGGAYERLLANGEPDLACDRRVRVNYRQIYTFSLATELGWLENGKATIDAMNQFLISKASINNESNTFAHLLDPHGNIKDSKQDTYDLAFYLLSCAQRFKTFKDDSAMNDANTMMTRIDTHIKGIKAGWLEGDYASMYRRQNPHMHMFEALMALYDASQQSKWLARAGEIFSMFESHFYDHEHGILLEYFNADWSPQFGTNGRVIEPGHMFEWVWLLRQYSEKTQSPVSSYADTLYKNAFALGKNVTGLYYDEINEKGHIIKATKRCWPITELIKASLAQAKASTNQQDRESYEKNAADGIQCLFTYYLNPNVPGSYYDQLNADDDVISDVAPASTLYHLIVAAKEAAKYCSNIKSVQKIG